MKTKILFLFALSIFGSNVNATERLYCDRLTASTRTQVNQLAQALSETSQLPEMTYSSRFKNKSGNQVYIFTGGRNEIRCVKWSKPSTRHTILGYSAYHAYATYSCYDLTFGDLDSVFRTYTLTIENRAFSWGFGECKAYIKKH